MGWDYKGEYDQALPLRSLFWEDKAELAEAYAPSIALKSQQPWF